MQCFLWSFIKLCQKISGDGYKNLIRDFECKYEEPERVALEFEKILMGV